MVTTTPVMDLAGMSNTELVARILRGVLPCEVLLVDRAAGLSAAKAQYKQIALRLHPDKNPGADACEAFKRASNALQSYVPVEAQQTRWSEFRPSAAHESTDSASWGPQPAAAAWQQPQKRRRVSAEASAPHIRQPESQPTEPTTAGSPPPPCGTLPDPAKERWQASKSRPAAARTCFSQPEAAGMRDSRGSTQGSSQRSVREGSGHSGGFAEFAFKGPGPPVASGSRKAGAEGRIAVPDDVGREGGGDTRGCIVAAKEKWGEARRRVGREQVELSPSGSSESDTSDEIPEESESGGEEVENARVASLGLRRQERGSAAFRTGTRRKHVGKRLYKQLDVAPS